MSVEKNIIAVAKDLIKFRSVSTEVKELNLCAKYIQDFFNGTDLSVKYFEHKGSPSIIVTKNTKTPKILLVGHFDVVQGEDEQFSPRIDGDRLYGRGALDMKTANSVLMHIMQTAATNDWDVGLMLTGDEEIGGFNGVKYLLDKEGYSCQLAIIPDGGFAVDVIVSKAKGLLHIAFHAVGKSAHASRPWEGDNPIDKLLTVLNKLETMFVPLSKHPSDHWVNTINISRFESGCSYNYIPSEASVYVDIRFVEGETADGWLKKIKKCLPKDVTMRVDVAGEPIDMSHSPLLKDYAGVVQNVLGKEAKYKVDFGTSDARHFAQHGIPVVINQPTGVGHHTKDEWVSVSSVGKFYEILASYLDNFAV